jgi:hypothetical protein
MAVWVVFGVILWDFLFFGLIVFNLENFGAFG